MDHDSDSLTDHWLIKYKLRWIQRIPYATLSTTQTKLLHVISPSFSSNLLQSVKTELHVTNRSRSTGLVNCHPAYYWLRLDTQDKSIRVE